MQALREGRASAEPAGPTGKESPRRRSPPRKRSVVEESHEPVASPTATPPATTAAGEDVSSPKKRDVGPSQESQTQESQTSILPRSGYPMTGVAAPCAHDCLLGRGEVANRHPGNRLFRRIVATRKAEYSKSGRGGKFAVAMEIVSEWRAMDPPGRFLKKRGGEGVWDDVGDEAAAVTKVMQALREGRVAAERPAGPTGKRKRKGREGSRRRESPPSKKREAVTLSTVTLPPMTVACKNMPTPPAPTTETDATCFMAGKNNSSARAADSDSADAVDAFEDWLRGNQNKGAEIDFSSGAAGEKVSASESDAARFPAGGDNPFMRAAVSDNPQAFALVHDPLFAGVANFLRAGADRFGRTLQEGSWVGAIDRPLLASRAREAGEWMRARAIELRGVAEELGRLEAIELTQRRPEEEEEKRHKEGRALLLEARSRHEEQSKERKPKEGRLLQEALVNKWIRQDKQSKTLQEARIRQEERSKERKPKEGRLLLEALVSKWIRQDGPSKGRKRADKGEDAEARLAAENRRVALQWEAREREQAEVAEAAKAAKAEVTAQKKRRRKQLQPKETQSRRSQPVDPESDKSRKPEPTENGAPSKGSRPKHVYHEVQDRERGDEEPSQNFATTNRPLGGRSGASLAWTCGRCDSVNVANEIQCIQCFACHQGPNPDWRRQRKQQQEKHAHRDGLLRVVRLLQDRDCGDEETSPNFATTSPSRRQTRDEGGENDGDGKVTQPYILI